MRPHVKAKNTNAHCREHLALTNGHHNGHRLHSLLERAFEPDKVDDQTETSNGCRYSDVARGSDVSFVVD
jgi:hypothetical protein